MIPSNAGHEDAEDGCVEMSAMQRELREDGHVPTVCEQMESQEWESPAPGEDDSLSSRTASGDTLVIEDIADKTLEDPVNVIFKSIIRDEIDKLGTPYSDLIHCMLQGMTREEAAEAMSRSTSWAKKYTLKALEVLAVRLRRLGLRVDSNDFESL